MEPYLRLPPGVPNSTDRYRRCLEISDRVQADRFVDELAHDYRRRTDNAVTLEEAREIEKANIGTWAGLHLSWWEQLKIFLVFHTLSPIFGREYPTAEEAFFAGLRTAIENAGKPMSAEVRAEMHRHTDHLFHWKHRK